MSSIVVGIGDIKVADSPGDVVKTFALGSCVAVIIYDQVKKTAGMVHIALPDSSIDQNKAHELPGYFADTGLPLLIDLMKQKGANRHNAWIKLVGGANVMHTQFNFDIGKRNLLAVKKILWRYGLGAIADDTGGTISRTVSIDVDCGEVRISSGGKQWLL